MPRDRKIGVALDFSKSSKLALKWSIDNLFDEGDTLYIIHIKPEKGVEVKNQMWMQSGSPLIPLSEFRQPEIMKQYDIESDIDVLDLLDTASRQKEANVVAKIYWGDAREKICEAVEEMKLDSIVLGNRGHGQLQRILLGTVTNYVLSHALCPVTVVNDPERRN